MAQFSQITITYNDAYISGLPTTTTTAVLSIPAGSDYVTCLLNMKRMGGILLSDGATFICLPCIVKVAAS